MRSKVLVVLSGISLLVLGSLMYSCGDEAIAAELGATNVGVRVNELVKNMSLTAQGRQYTNVKMNKDEVEDTSPVYQVRGILSSTMFDDVYLTRLWFGAVKNEGTTVIENYRPILENEIRIVNNDYAEFVPYVTAYFPHKPKDGEAVGTDFDIGFYTAGKLPVSTVAGDFEFSLNGNFYAKQGSQAETIKKELDPSAREHFGLAQDAENPEIEKADATLITEYSTAASFTPAMLSDLSLTGIVYFEKTFEPKYKETIIDGEPRTEKTGYHVSDVTMTRIVLSYAATEKITVANDFWAYSEGFYKERRNANTGNRYTNIMKLSYKLF